jgi:amidase
MKIVQRSYQHRLYDCTLPPVLRVEPGEQVTFETTDALYGRVDPVAPGVVPDGDPPRGKFNKGLGPHDAGLHIPYSKSSEPGGDPLTGPVYVEGAKPGDTLVAEVIKIEQDGPGFQLVGPNRGVVNDEITDWSFEHVRNDGDHFSLTSGIALPYDPVIGSFGNAPTGAPTYLMNPVCGTSDIPAAKTGAKLHVPIEMPGALFSLGDIHACQGDGEVVGAPEISARVTMRFSLQPGRIADWFMIEDNTHWHSTRSAQNTDEATRQAVLQNARFIARTHDIKLRDALVLLTLVGKISIPLTGKWGDCGPHVCSSFCKEQVNSALAGYRRG